MSGVVNPSAQNIRKYLNKWDSLENYILQENSLSMLFNQYCPENKKIEHILLKVSALNDFYSTHIYDTYSVSKHILKNEIDKPLRTGDLGIVNKIARVSTKGKTRNFYSFATKYCSHHKPDQYPIYDSYVENCFGTIKRQMFFLLF